MLTSNKIGLLFGHQAIGTPIYNNECAKTKTTVESRYHVPI